MLVSLKRRMMDPVMWFAHVTGLSTRLAHRGSARIIMFHGVGDEHYSAEDFVTQMKWLARSFRVVRLEALVEDLRDGTALDGRDVVLTFDDGLRNNVTVAYPVLRELGLPATFFVCPGLTESGRWLWNHEARARLRTLEPGERSMLALELGAGGSGVEAIVTWMKTLDSTGRRAAEEAIRAATSGFEPEATQRHAFDVASWAELRGLSTEIVTIGSHSLTHPILTNLRADELRVELAGSRHMLQERMGRGVDLFCYPNGSEDPRVRAEAGLHYQAAVTTRPGEIKVGDDLHGLCRVSISPGLPQVSWRLHRQNSWGKSRPAATR